MPVQVGENRNTFFYYGLVNIGQKSAKQGPLYLTGTVARFLLRCCAGFVFLLYLLVPTRPNASKLQTKICR